MAHDIAETEVPKQEAGKVAGESINGREYLKRDLSPKSIEANRRNALRSTGPRTRKGKKAVRWNALKHGLLARSVVISFVEGEENAAEFRKLLNHLRKDLHTVGILEEILIEKIAVCYWRLWRVIRSETGEIRENLDSIVEKFYASNAFKFQRAKNLDSLDPSYDLTSNSYGLDFLTQLLQKFKDEVKGTGFLSEHSLQAMTRYFGNSGEGLASHCSALNLAVMHGNNRAGSGHVMDAKGSSSKILLKVLDEELSRLQNRLNVIWEEEDQRLETERARRSLPDAAATDKILRYEIAIERQLYRAMNQLERLQRQRSGENVPPPLPIDVSGEK